MKRLLVLSTVILLISTITFTSVLAAQDPFVGAWTSTDHDGSFQTLVIGNGPDDTYHVRYYDFGASSCGINPNTGELYTASYQGFLTGEDGSLMGEVPVYCITHPPKLLGSYYISYEYDDVTDTIIDSGGVEWTRR